MFCKPEVKLILDSLWAERELGSPGIRLATTVNQEITAQLSMDDSDNQAEEQVAASYQLC